MGLFSGLLKAVPLLDVGSKIFGGLLGSSSAKDQNQMQMQMAQQQMDFQERMSNTAHQREVKDLRAANLNPILSANKGASTPGGAQAQMVSEQAPLANTLMQGLSSAAQIQNIRAQTYKLEEDARVSYHNAAIAKNRALQEAMITRDAEKIFLSPKNNAERQRWEFDKAKAEAEIAGHRVPAERATGEMWKQFAEQPITGNTQGDSFIRTLMLLLNRR